MPAAATLSIPQPAQVTPPAGGRAGYGAFRLVTADAQVSAPGDDFDARWSALMAAAQSGDGAAYAELLREALPLLRVVVRARHRGDAVEDVVQDILLSVHRVRHTYDPSRSFRAWLLAIAQRRSIDALRTRTRRHSRETALDPELPDMTRAHEADSAGAEASLARAMAALPAAQRQALELVKLHELSFAEASARSGHSVSALKVSVHRALKTLRAHLKKV
jgi:RNA polymerase sigma-70 factor (ECF subfamily)